MFNSTNIAERIKIIAKEKGIPIGKMLSDCNLSKNTLSSMQSGGFLPRMETILKIAEYLDVSIDYLLGKTEQKNTTHTVSSVDGIDLTLSEEEIIKLIRQMDKEQLVQAILDLQKIISDHEPKKAK